MGGERKAFVVVGGSERMKDVTWEGISVLLKDAGVREHEEVDGGAAASPAMWVMVLQSQRRGASEENLRGRKSLPVLFFPPQHNRDMHMHFLPAVPRHDSLLMLYQERD